MKKAERKLIQNGDQMDIEGGQVATMSGVETMWLTVTTK